MLVNFIMKKLEFKVFKEQENDFFHDIYIVKTISFLKQLFSHCDQIILVKNAR